MRVLKKIGVVLLVLILLVVLAIVGFFGFNIVTTPRTEPTADLQASINALIRQRKSANAKTAIVRAAVDALDYEIVGQPEVNKRDAVQDIKLTYFNPDKLVDGIEQDMQALIDEWREKALTPDEIYDENDNYLDEVTLRAYNEALTKRLAKSDNCIETVIIPMQLHYTGSMWQVTNIKDIENLVDLVKLENYGYADAVRKLKFVSFHYTLPDQTSNGPAANVDFFGETDNPSVIADLLRTDEAVALLEGKNLTWNENIDFIPGSYIQYYLDDTILAIAWQEEVDGAVGTFSEVIISDGTQLRRKIAASENEVDEKASRIQPKLSREEEFHAENYFFPSELAIKANAIVAATGDNYDYYSYLNYGVYVYNGIVIKSGLTSGQTCYFTKEGNMIFSEENEFKNEAEAQRFVKRNNVMFSLCLGPILVKDGRIAEIPAYYPQGDANYAAAARSAIGQIGELHYLLMAINTDPYYVESTTIEQAAKAMFSRGCVQAYELQGSYNAELLFDGVPINPVYFGEEKECSDILYFATAIPEETGEELLPSPSPARK